MTRVPSEATLHEQTAALAWWIASRTNRVLFSTAYRPPQVLSTRSADPIGMTATFMSMADELGLHYRVYIITQVPSYGWYPLIEIRDQDGDHLWDIYGIRYAPDYDGTPLSFEKALRASKLHYGQVGAIAVEQVKAADFRSLPNGIGPDFGLLATLPAIELKPDQASILMHDVAFFRDDRPLVVGKKDASSADFKDGKATADGTFPLAFAYAGDVTGPLGRATFVQRYALRDLIPGDTYVFSMGLVKGKTGSMLLMPDGVTLETKKVSELEARYTFQASASEARVDLGTFDKSFLEFDFLRWEKE